MHEAQKYIEELGIDHYDRERDLPRLLGFERGLTFQLSTGATIKRLGKAINSETHLRNIGHQDASYMRLTSLEEALRAELLRFATENTAVYHHVLEGSRL